MLGLEGKVNTCESMINPVKSEESKMLTDSSQKAIWLVLVFAYNQTKIIKPSGDSWHLTLSLVIYTEHGKPVPSPVMASRPQGRPLEGGHRMVEKAKAVL